jgi:hypothetical protein
MSDLQTISIVLGGVGLFIAAINSIISSRKADQQRQVEIETRQAELFVHIYTQWSDPTFAEQYGLVQYKYSDKNLLSFFLK